MPNRRTQIAALLALLCFSFVACLSPSGSGQVASNTGGDSGGDGGEESSPTPTPLPTARPTSDPTGEGGETPAPTPDETPTAEPTDLPEGETCAQLDPGQPVGLACIHCMHPNAHEQARELVRIMRQSCKQNLVTNFLIDGRFSTDDAFLAELIRSLAENRSVTIVLYLSNGVSQRFRDPFNPGIFGTGTSVDSFRHAIVNDAGFRLAYQQVVQRALDVQANVQAGVRFILVPALEDNFTDNIFQNVLELTRATAGDRMLYGRNPCPNCADGNGTGIPDGVLEEEHTAGPFHTSNGLVTNDNSAYRFSDESGGGLTLAQLVGVKGATEAQNNMFILWTAEYQGLPVVNNQINGRPPPDARNYAFPSASEAVELIDFLN